MPQGRMSKWYAFKDEQVDMSPKKPGAYQLAYKDTIVYIGKADTSIRSRLYEHRKRKTFMKVTHFRFREVEWASEARELERKLCEAFQKKNHGKLPRLMKNKPPKEEKALCEL